MTDTIIKVVASSDYKSLALLRENGDVLVGLKENIGQAQSFIIKYSYSDAKNKISDIAW